MHHCCTDVCKGSSEINVATFEQKYGKTHLKIPATGTFYWTELNNINTSFIFFLTYNRLYLFNTVCGIRIWTYFLKWNHE